VVPATSSADEGVLPHAAWLAKQVTALSAYSVVFESMVEIGSGKTLSPGQTYTLTCTLQSIPLGE